MTGVVSIGSVVVGLVVVVEVGRSVSGGGRTSLVVVVGWDEGSHAAVANRSTATTKIRVIQRITPQTYPIEPPFHGLEPVEAAAGRALHNPVQRRNHRGCPIQSKLQEVTHSTTRCSVEEED